MTRFDRFTGSILVLGAAAAFINLACDHVIAHPTWGGAFIAVGQLFAGFAVCASVWRDRL